MLVEVLKDGLGASLGDQLSCFRNGVVEIGLAGDTQEVVQVFAQLRGYLVHQYLFRYAVDPHELFLDQLVPFPNFVSKN